MLRRPTAWPWLLAFALLAAQALGFMHRVTHAPHLHTAAAQAGEAAHGDGWLERLFAGHDEDSCRLIDSLSHGGAAAPQAVCAPLVPAAYLLPLWAGQALARWAALFDARGPPPSVH